MLKHLFIKKSFRALLGIFLCINTTYASDERWKKEYALSEVITAIQTLDTYSKSQISWF